MVTYSKKSPGFTVIELLIVIVVIAILAAISVVAYNGLQQRAANSAIDADINQVKKSISLFSSAADGVTLPTSISNCPVASSTTLCLQAPTGVVRNYTPRVTNGADGLIMNPGYQLTVLNGAYGQASGTMAVTGGTNEFMRYMDLAPLIDSAGLGSYSVEFDMKTSLSTATTMYVYLQNGNGSRYSFGGHGFNIPVTSNYQRTKLTVTIGYDDPSLSAAWLAFFGKYGTGNVPTVKNVVVKKL